MPLLLLLLAAVALAVPAAAAPVEIRHQRLSCVPLDGHPVVSATASRVEDVATAELQFRREEGDDWYGVPMFLDGGSWSARLPRATSKLKKLQYRVVMTSINLDPSALDPVDVVVARGCPTPADRAAGTTLVVRAPRGGGLVPRGFSEQGVMAAGAPPAPDELGVKTATWAKVAAGAAVLAGGVAVASGSAGASSTAPLPPGAGRAENPGFAFSHTVPGPGSELSLRSSTLTVFVNMLREPPVAIDLTWRFELYSAGSPGLVCAFTQGVFNDARSPLGLVFVGPLQSTSACGERFEVGLARLVVSHQGSFIYQDNLLYETTVPLAFHVAP